MKIVVLVILYLFTNALGFSQSPEEQVKKAITIFFKGFHAKDSLMMKQVVADHVVVQTTSVTQEGKTLFKTEDIHTLYKNIASIPAKVEFKEELTNFSIQVDRTMANAWVDYTFFLNKEFSHCGVNSFQLINFDGNWKIIYLIDTRGKEGCEN
ncbi:nuclear transport factor 2 family protein [Flavobacterium sp. ASW18X]|uniref:nuclear transport factor 2 family protein n=1 Tax=Flavobacterium sp. ASW18X TaxID=2572595 RepID=UPI0010AEAADE|nr:nuclear transport factor 2 family protein [Flavobacterium sp. ASW18X]TKD65891.1 nuclear transport factor 2 family protein [Flavobacterium sp. ASW18X]